MTYDQMIAALEREASKTGFAQPLARMGVDLLKQNKDIFRYATEEIFSHLLGLIAARQHDQAKEFFIKNFARASDLIDGMKAGADAIRNAPADLETVFEQIYAKLTSGFMTILLNMALKSLAK